MGAHTQFGGSFFIEGLILNKIDVIATSSAGVVGGFILMVIIYNIKKFSKCMKSTFTWKFQLNFYKIKKNDGFTSVKILV